MKKVYLLLRNNHQTGPYTLDELWQQQLRPTDLVWVDGCSQAWLYPSELEELEVFAGQEKPEAVENQKAAASRSMELEQRAEQLRQTVLATRRYSAPDVLRDATSVEALRLMAQQRIEFVDHRKKESPFFEWLSAVVVTALVVAGVYGGVKFFSAQPNLPPLVATKMISADTHAAKVLARPVPPPPTMVPEKINQDTATSVAVVEQKPTLPARSKRKINPEARPATAIRKITPPKPSADTSSALLPTLTGGSLKKTIELEPKAIVAAAPLEKKKSFGLFKGLFKKKKREEGRTEQQSGAQEN